MDKLEVLASITRLSPNVVRVLGQNPGKFTLQGTNTYIIGKENPYTLVDTGEGKEEYIPILEQALKETAVSVHSNRPHISDIVISHWHPDHVGGIPSVLALLRRLWEQKKTDTPFVPPRLHKLPIPSNLSIPLSEHYILPTILDSLPSHSFTPTKEGNAFHDLHDSQLFVAHTTSFHVLHTPGHTVDSISLYIPEDRALYTADTVLGQGTAVFEDLGTYISSLRKMKDFRTPEGQSYSDLYPGHGPVVSDGVRLIETYIKHRLDREDEILKAMHSTPPPPGDSSGWTTWTLVKYIYAAYPESLWLPASNSVYLHLRKLEQEGRISRLGGEGVDIKWAIQGKL